ncbi:tetratricopeptide repeat protein [Telmatospirillum siberiense]|nr:tetratricopeptide repeat-containing glycosyltransferase family protein [Telmatospirillum siberiense]
MDQAARAAIVAAVSSGDTLGALRRAQDMLEGEGHYDGYLALVKALSESGDPVLAVKCFAALREILPANAEVARGYGAALLQLGNIAYRGGEIAQARGFYRQALRADAHSVKAWTNLGQAERFLGRPAEAEACFRKAVSLVPDEGPAHFNLATLLLEEERWQDGFAEFEWRSNLSRIPKILAGFPLWNAQAPQGASVALWNDQGLGDAMLFLRYLPRLRSRGMRIVLFLPPVLTDLAATAPGVDAIAEIGQPIPQVDYQLPLASLPHLLGEADPADAWTGPYLFAASAPAGRVTYRRSIGLVWAAGSDSPNGRVRSIPLEGLAPLATLPDIDWIALQMGPARAEIAGSPWAGRLRDPSPGLANFADTAAVVSGLDLVISVDTSVAHLAGAMGKPVWILLPRPCDWKWGREGSASVWYPTASLFRQDGSRDWDSVVSAVDAALRGLPAQ